MFDKGDIGLFPVASADEADVFRKDFLWILQRN